MVGRITDNCNGKDGSYTPLPINCERSFYSDLIILAILPGALPRKGSTMED